MDRRFNNWLWFVVMGGLSTYIVIHLQPGLGNSIMYGILFLLFAVNVIYGEIRISGEKKKIAEIMKKRGFTRVKPAGYTTLRYRNSNRSCTKYIFWINNGLVTISKADSEKIVIDPFCNIYFQGAYAVVYKYDDSKEEFYSKTDYLPQ